MESLFKRLRFYAEIGNAERAALCDLPYREEKFKAGADIIERGAEPGEAFVVKGGWAARAIQLADGRTQILNFLLPGDVYDLQVLIADSTDHSITAITPVKVLWIRQRDLLRLFDGSTRAGVAFWWCALQEEAILREQIVRNGRRTARERIAHLILELHRRAAIVGEADDDSFYMPLSQPLLADALGLSFVHVNRVIRQFMVDGFIVREKNTMHITDRKALAAVSDFSEDYLHLDVGRRQLKFSSE